MLLLAVLLARAATGMGSRARLRTVARAITFSATRNNFAFREQFEPQRACNWSSFYQTDVDDVPQSVHGTAARADQRVPRLVVIVIFRPQRAHGDQPVGAGILQLHEQPGAGDAGDAALK